MKRKIKTVVIYSLLFIGLLTLTFSCEKERKNNNTGGNDKIEGRVTDANMQSLADVIVTAYGQSTTTDDNGNYSFYTNLSNDTRNLVSFSREGYFDNTVGFIQQSGKTSIVNVALIERVLIGSFDNSEGGTVKDDDENMEITFTENSLVKTNGTPFEGEVNIYGTYINPDDENFGDIVPGGDLVAVDENGDDGMLVSFGMIRVEAETNTGEQLQLNNTVNGCAKIPDAMLADAPEEIPVWVLGGIMWEMIGMATKNGDQYCFTSNTLGTINCDLFSRTALIKGYLCKEGEEIGEEILKIGQISVTTAEDGSFAALVPANKTIKVSSDFGNATIGPFEDGEVADCVLIGTCSENIDCGSIPIADFTGTPTSGTAPLTVSFTDQSTNDPTSWQWNFGDGGSSTEQNPTHIFTEEGTYTVQLTASNSAGADGETKNAYITVTGSGSGGQPCPGTPTVTYEGKTYNTVQIGTQCWLKENLDVGAMINGSINQTDNGIIEKYCYDNDPANCEIYGGLYHWDEIMEYNIQEGAKGICPNGWHIPTDDEWKILEGTTDSQYDVGHPIWDEGGLRGSDVGTNLRSTTGWSFNNNGLDLFGFSLKPAGWNYEDNFVWLEGNAVVWTSTSDFQGQFVWYREMGGTKSKRSSNPIGLLSNSVRCIKD